MVASIRANKRYSIVMTFWFITLKVRCVIPSILISYEFTFIVIFNVLAIVTMEPDSSAVTTWRDTL